MSVDAKVSRKIPLYHKEYFDYCTVDLQRHILSRLTTSEDDDRSTTASPPPALYPTSSPVRLQSHRIEKMIQLNADLDDKIKLPQRACAACGNRSLNKPCRDKEKRIDQFCEVLGAFTCKSCAMKVKMSHHISNTEHVLLRSNEVINRNAEASEIERAIIEQVKNLGGIGDKYARGPSTTSSAPSPHRIQKRNPRYVYPQANRNNTPVMGDPTTSHTRSLSPPRLHKVESKGLTRNIEFANKPINRTLKRLNRMKESIDKNSEISFFDAQRRTSNTIPIYAQMLKLPSLAEQNPDSSPDAKTRAGRRPPANTKLTSPDVADPTDFASVRFWQNEKKNEKNNDWLEQFHRVSDKRKKEYKLDVLALATRMDDVVRGGFQNNKALQTDVARKRPTSVSSVGSSVFADNDSDMTQHFDEVENENDLEAVHGAPDSFGLPDKLPDIIAVSDADRERLSNLLEDVASRTSEWDYTRPNEQATDENELNELTRGLQPPPRLDPDRDFRNLPYDPPKIDMLKSISEEGEE